MSSKHDPHFLYSALLMMTIIGSSFPSLECRSLLPATPETMVGHSFSKNPHRYVPSSSTVSNHATVIESPGEPESSAEYVPPAAVNSNKEEAGSPNDSDNQYSSIPGGSASLGGADGGNQYTFPMFTLMPFPGLPLGPPGLGVPPPFIGFPPGFPFPGLPGLPPFTGPSPGGRYGGYNSPYGPYPSKTSPAHP